MSYENLLKTKNVFFFGVGGIGISGIARMFLAQGKQVSGSDTADSQIIEDLKKLGAKIEIGQALSAVPKSTDLIIYTAALEVADPGFVAQVKKLDIPSMNYSEALGEITKNAFTVAVAGTHGKTTTTAMIAEILMHAGQNPTVFVGSVLNRAKSNFVSGNPGLVVVEADEYRRSFLSLSPKILVITNIDRDHLDYYKDLADIQNAFLALAKKVPEDGFVVLDGNNPHVDFLIDELKCTVVDYSEMDVSKLKLPIPGRHNIENAKASMAVSALFEIPEKTILEGLAEFSGTARRFEFRGKTARGADVYDDYAHNPQKVKSAIAGAREKYPAGKCKLVVVFQPHLFSRTKLLFDDFVSAFAGADEVICLPIYPARELDPGDINSEMLASAIAKTGRSANFAKTFESAVALSTKLAGANDVIITMGAGETNKVADRLVCKVKSL